MIGIANITRCKPNRVFGGPSGYHGVMDWNLPVVRPGGIVLRVEHQLRALTHAFFCRFRKAKAFETDHHANLHAAEVERLKTVAGSVGDRVERR